MSVCVCVVCASDNVYSMYDIDGGDNEPHIQWHQVTRWKNYNFASSYALDELETICYLNNFLFYSNGIPEFNNQHHIIVLNENWKWKIISISKSVKQLVFQLDTEITHQLAPPSIPYKIHLLYVYVCRFRSLVEVRWCYPICIYLYITYIYLVYFPLGFLASGIVIIVVVVATRPQIPFYHEWKRFHNDNNVHLCVCCCWMFVCSVWVCTAVWDGRRKRKSHTEHWMYDHLYMFMRKRDIKLQEQTTAE